jgi:hypothetical protein
MVGLTAGREAGGGCGRHAPHGELVHDVGADQFLQNRVAVLAGPHQGQRQEGDLRQEDARARRVSAGKAGGGLTTASLALSAAAALAPGRGGARETCMSCSRTRTAEASKVGRTSAAHSLSASSAPGT